MDPKWAIEIRNQCVQLNVAFFFKQWGGRTPKARGRLLEGREWSQFPREAFTSTPEYEPGIGA
jgi:protein gp37